MFFVLSKADNFVSKICLICMRRMRRYFERIKLNRMLLLWEMIETGAAGFVSDSQRWGPHVTQLRPFHGKPHGKGLSSPRPEVTSLLSVGLMTG